MHEQAQRIASTDHVLTVYLQVSPMLGIWRNHAQAYLLILMIVTTIVFALPIFVAPLAWARWFRWRLPGETDLAVYFGRCCADGNRPNLGSYPSHSAVHRDR
jgi:hypothetical protein